MELLHSQQDDCPIGRRNPVCQRHFQMIWSEQRYFSLAARKFRDFVIHYFANPATPPTTTTSNPNDLALSGR